MNLHRRIHEENVTGRLDEFSPADPNCSIVWWIPLAMAAISAAGSYAAAKQQSKAQQAAIDAQQPGIDASLRAQALANASADPTNPLNENLTRILEAAMRENVLRGLREAFSADRRLTRKSGRAGVFLNPERRDETRSRSILEAFSGIGSSAREEASNRLISAATGNVNAARALAGPLANIGNVLLAQGQDRADLIGAFSQNLSALGQNEDFMSGLSGLFSGSQATTVNPATTNALQAFNRGSIYEAL